MTNDSVLMQRALQLAALGAGNVSPNPMVGCVLVSGMAIIGEGWHRQYGGPHAEVEAVRDAVRRGHSAKLAGATAYVSLEPCSHFGKTPPCADLLIAQAVGRVVICTEDPNPLVKGRGIVRLREAGITVDVGMLAQEGRELNRRFWSGITRKRPYVIIKWAESRDGMLAGANGQPVKISCPETDVLVHRWRAEEDAILVGKQTVLNDDPALNLRHWKGNHPVRIVLDTHLEIGENYQVRAASQPTILVNTIREEIAIEQLDRYRRDTPATGYLKADTRKEGLRPLLERLYELGIRSVLVEGGRQVHESFLKAGIWDEIRQIKGAAVIGTGIGAPAAQGVFYREERIKEDVISYFRNELPVT